MKRVTLIALLLIASGKGTAQDSPGDLFFLYSNTCQIYELEELLSDDFVMSRPFADATTGKDAYVAHYMNYSCTFHPHFSILKSSEKGEKEVFVVSDESDELEYLGVPFPTWKMTISSKDDKVTSVKVEATAGPDAYFRGTDAKNDAFSRWVDQKYTDPEVRDSAKNKPAERLRMLREYASEMPKPYTETPFTGEPCSRINKFTLKKRLSFYPFSKAKSIAIISYKDAVRFAEHVSKASLVTDLSKADPQKLLTDADIDALTDLLYNIGFESDMATINEVPPCPELKNAIVFLDDKSRPFEYIALYFGCDVSEYS